MMLNTGRSMRPGFVKRYNPGNWAAVQEIFLRTISVTLGIGCNDKKNQYPHGKSSTNYIFFLAAAFLESEQAREIVRDVVSEISHQFPVEHDADVFVRVRHALEFLHADYVRLQECFQIIHFHCARLARLDLGIDCHVIEQAARGSVGRVHGTDESPTFRQQSTDR